MINLRKSGLYVAESEQKAEPKPADKPSPAPRELSDSDKWLGEQLLLSFRKMPEAAQVEVMARLKMAFLRRSGGLMPSILSNQLACELADVFGANGCEQEEYT